MLDISETDVPSSSSQTNRDELEHDSGQQFEITVSSEPVRRRKKGVTFNTETVTELLEMGNNISVDASHPTTTTTTTTTAPPPQQRRQQVETEDELTGYSKVVVSHNLAEEILDEIYGKMTELESGQATDYENADFFSSAAPPFFLFQDSECSEGSEPPRSLADEILDELYGGDLRVYSENDDSSKQDDENDFYEEIRDLTQSPTRSDELKKDGAKNSRSANKRNVNPVLAGKSVFFYQSLKLGSLIQDQALNK